MENAQAQHQSIRIEKVVARLGTARCFHDLISAPCVGWGA